MNIEKTKLTVRIPIYITYYVNNQPSWRFIPELFKELKLNNINWIITPTTEGKEYADENRVLVKEELGELIASKNVTMEEGLILAAQVKNIMDNATNHFKSLFYPKTFRDIDKVFKRINIKKATTYRKKFTDLHKGGWEYHYKQAPYRYLNSDFLWLDEIDILSLELFIKRYPAFEEPFKRSTYKNYEHHEDELLSLKSPLPQKNKKGGKSLLKRIFRLH